VLIERLDRLARDLIVQEAPLSYFRQHGFTIVSVMEPDLMANETDRLPANDGRVRAVRQEAEQ
jgi:hypothetical protein